MTWVQTKLICQHQTLAAAAGTSGVAASKGHWAIEFQGLFVSHGPGSLPLLPHCPFLSLFVQVLKNAHGWAMEIRLSGALASVAAQKSLIDFAPPRV